MTSSAAVQGPTVHRTNTSPISMISSLASWRLAHSTSWRARSVVNSLVHSISQLSIRALLCALFWRAQYKCMERKLIMNADTILCINYLKTVPGDCSPHHFSLMHNLGAGGPMLYSHITLSTHNLTYPLSPPFTRGGRDVFTCASSRQSSVRDRNHQFILSIISVDKILFSSRMLYLQFKVDFIQGLSLSGTLTLTKLAK